VESSLSEAVDAFDAVERAPVLGATVGFELHAEAIAAQIRSFGVVGSPDPPADFRADLDEKDSALKLCWSPVQFAAAVSYTVESRHIEAPNKHGDDEKHLIAQADDHADSPSFRRVYEGSECRFVVTADDGVENCTNVFRVRSVSGVRRSEWAVVSLFIPRGALLASKWSSAFKSANITIADRRVTYSASNVWYQYVLLEPAVRAGVHTWRFRIVALRNSHWIHFGVAAPGPKVDDSYADPTNYAITSSGRLIAGSGQSVSWPVKPPFQSGDEVSLTLNCEARTVRVHSAHIDQTIADLPAGQQWVPHINLYHSGDSVELIA